MGASNWQGLAIPKPTPRYLEKAKKVAAARKAERECYAQVDTRDSHCCRVCRKRVGGVGILQAAHHHHILYRSKGGEHDPAQVCLLCVACHSAIHNGELRLTGDANARNSIGVLCGLTLEQADESGWKVLGQR